MSRLWQIAAGILGLAAAVLAFMLQGAQRQRDSARERAERQARRADTAEQRIAQREAADVASAKAKKEGEHRVEQVRDEARSGRRDHFANGWVRDDD
ncbi:hypothetical protein [uncultured Cobetia sp.]|uniref:hypothetical protein n=1 Tax=uncultured Cobetia sp. TaxID=410706 RepID=UPI000E7FFF24|nr:hypothetical protein [Cobetia sp.]